ncbi:hypothetical protein [Arthrobacter sp. StoSoilB22]|uniref:hypothetical protein n=1 Tax=Arthrobacter sp. StoSoilB22 TaxID=2830996 RepID=UPI001CC7D1A4|nr:hypothetical protein [Arthrobacter sp. StoSoilB22]BCW62162.1 hypothetical protein StoSoilB22_11350 [Arthrobacter sp. StoSoilB22]
MKEDGHTIVDPALDTLNLRLQLGVRADSAHEIAATILASVSVLERLDPRPMEWITVTRAAPATAGGDFLPRNIDEATSLVESGARKDDAGKFYVGSGYFVQLVSFLNGTDRSVSPFYASIADGSSDAPSHNSLKLTFKQAMIPSRETFVACLVELFDLWPPEMGGLFSSAITRKNRDQPIWYPPVGVVTYFAYDSGYVLPEDPLVELRQLPNGTLAVLKNWTLEAVQRYEAAFRAVNNGIPNERSAVRNHICETQTLTT